VIRFSAFLVVAAVGTLVAGVVTSELTLVYIAIGVSGVALLALGAGAAANWRELTGKPAAAEARAQEAVASQPAVAKATPVQATPVQAAPAQVATPEPATAVDTPAWSGAVPVGSSRSGHPPAEPPAATRPTSPSSWNWRDDPAPRPIAPWGATADEPPAADDDPAVQDQTMIFRAPDQTMIFRAQPSPAESVAPPAEPAAPADDAPRTTPPPRTTPRPPTTPPPSPRKT
jgi:hypothetical protein